MSATETQAKATAHTEKPLSTLILLPVLLKVFPSFLVLISCPSANPRVQGADSILGTSPTRPPRANSSFLQGFPCGGRFYPDKPTPRPAGGISFVDLSTPTEADRAISELNGQSILDRKVSIQLARKPEDHAEGATSGVRVNMTSTVNTLAAAAAAVGLGLGEAVLLDVQAVL